MDESTDITEYFIGADDESTNITEYFTGGIDQVTGGIGHVIGGSDFHTISKNSSDYKDSVTRALLSDDISECSLYLGKASVCMTDTMLNSVSKHLHIDGTSEEILSAAKSATNCDDERCVLKAMEPVVGREVTEHEISTRLKVAGPTDSKLLNNINIDETLRQWTIPYPDFYPYHFHMLNYAQYAYVDGYVVRRPDTLATVTFADLYPKYKCCGCVINTDTYQGPGQHWMALFADARGSDWTVEFFNSSGNGPAPEWVNWMEKTRAVMEEIIASSGIKATVRTVRASSVRHQKSRTECGLYSLFYIWARLNRIPVEYFATNHIPDQLMFELRQHLFNDTSRQKLKKFTWNEYKNTAKIKWE